MAAYVSIRIKVDDPSKLKPYQELAPSIINKYNGKIIVRGGEVVTLEGPEEKRRIVIIELISGVSVDFSLNLSQSQQDLPQSQHKAPPKKNYPQKM